MDGWVDEWMDGWVDGWMGGWMDGWVNGWMDWWMDGWALVKAIHPLMRIVYADINWENTFIRAINNEFLFFSTKYFCLSLFLTLSLFHHHCTYNTCIIYTNANIHAFVFLHNHHISTSADVCLIVLDRLKSINVIIHPYFRPSIILSVHALFHPFMHACIHPSDHFSRRLKLDLAR